MIWSRKRNFYTQITPKPPRLAAMTRRVESDTRLASATSTVERSRPASVNTQNGTISRRKLTLPSWSHTHRLFRKDTGIAVMLTAATFDHVGLRSRIPTSTTSISWVRVTPTTDTIEYLMASAPRPPVTRSTARKTVGQGKELSVR